MIYIVRLIKKSNLSDIAYEVGAEYQITKQSYDRACGIKPVAFKRPSVLAKPNPKTSKRKANNKRRMVEVRRGK